MDDLAHSCGLTDMAHQLPGFSHQLSISVNSALVCIPTFTNPPLCASGWSCQTRDAEVLAKLRVMRYGQVGDATRSGGRVW